MGFHGPLGRKLARLGDRLRMAGEHHRRDRSASLREVRRGGPRVAEGRARRTVEEDAIGFDLADRRRDRVVSHLGEGGDLVALVAQHGLDEVTDVLVVVDQQHAKGVPGRERPVLTFSHRASPAR
jgi:hypothetical protein